MKTTYKTPMFVVDYENDDVLTASNGGNCGNKEDLLKFDWNDFT